MLKYIFVMIALFQFNNKGQNFLHIALQNNQVENVLFLLSINVDVNSRVKDPTQTPPLHLAAAGGNEVLVRSFILSGAKVCSLMIFMKSLFFKINN